MRILKRTVSVFLVVLMLFSSVPLTGSLAQQISDFCISNFLTLNASATDIPTAGASNSISISPSANVTTSVLSDHLEELQDEELERSEINYMSNGISAFNLTSQVSDYSSNPNTYTVLLLDIESEHDMLYDGQYLCTLGSPVAQVKASALKLIEQIRLTRGTTNVAIVTFCSSVEVVQNFTSDYSVMKQSINSISSGSTWANINGALKKADELLSAIADKNVDKNIVLFSQGLPYAGDYADSGKYSTNDCSWHRTDNNICAYQYANSAYATSESLKSKYNLYSVGLYQSFEIVPEQGQNLLSFAKRFNEDMQNKGYYDITNIDDLEFSFAQEVFNLGVAIDPDKIIIPVRAIDTAGKLVPIEGAEVTVYLGSEAKDTRLSESDGFVVFSKNELYQKGVSAESLYNCTVSAHFNVGNVILCSEDIYTNGTWVGRKLLSNYSLICDEPREYVDLTVAYSSGIKQSKIDTLMSNYSKDLAQMTNGHVLLSGYSLIQVNSDSELPSTNADVKVYKNLNRVAHSSVGTYKNGGSIEIDDSDNAATLCHESGHLLFGFLDEYKAAGKDGTVTDYKMSPLWSNLKRYSSNNGYVARPDQAPSLFGVMERQQKTLEMSNSNDYFYVELLDGSKESQPEAYTWQYYYNGMSTEGQLMDNFERAVNSYGYSINYTDTMASPMTAEYWFAELSDNNSITPTEYPSDAYLNSEITNAKIVDIDFSYYDEQLLLKTNDSDTLCYTYDNGIVTEVIFETSEYYNIAYIDLSNVNVLTFAIIKEIDNKYFRNEYIIEKYPSKSDAFSAEQHLFYSHDEQSNTVIQISSNISEMYDGYHSVSKKHYVLCDNSFGVINENLSYIPNVNYDSLKWYYTDVSGNSSFLNTSITTGESNSINASCFFTGIGTYILMSSNVAERLDASPSIVNISTDNCIYDGQVDIKVEMSDDVPVFYKLYHNRNNTITKENLATIEYEVFNYDDSLLVDLSEGYGRYNFAVTAVFKDGSESALSNVYSYDVVAKDSDNDGIPDYWIEKYYQLADLDSIATADPDDDGLDNLTEYEYDTNPLNPDTDGDNVYDKIELLKGLDPLNPITNGKTDDYIVAYGTPELEICEVKFDEDFIYFSVKNDTDGKAMRTLVEATVGSETIAMWSVNVDKKSIVQFAIDRSVVENWDGLTIEVDSGKLVRDADYSNNVFTYSSATDISLADINIVKGTSQLVALNANPVGSNEICKWSIINGDCITLNNDSSVITANKIGQATISVETLSGLTDDCLISVVAFEGAEYTDFDCMKINDDTAVTITGYFGEENNIRIPDSIGGLPVVAIHSRAFNSCNIESIYITYSVTEISHTAFYVNNTIKSYEVDENNPVYCSENGTIYSKDKTTLVAYPPAETAETFDIPNTVVHIGSYAFNNNPFLIGVTLKNGTTDIDSYAFYQCSSIKRIDIDKSVTDIGTYAFYGCTNLESLHYSGDINDWCKIHFASSYSNPSFYTCSIYINDQPVSGDIVLNSSIGDYSLYNCTDITGVFVEENAETIGKYAFRGCSGLKNVTVSNSVISIERGAFRDCNAIEIMNLPFVGNSQTATGLKSVFGYIFDYTVSGGNIKQYYSSTSSYTYYVPSTIKNVTITNATQIPYGAFYNCSSITDITINDSVASMGEKCFANCNGLVNLTIPFVGESRSATGVSGVFGYFFNSTDTSTDGTVVQYYETSGSKYYYIPTGIEFVTLTDSEQLSYGAFYNCANIKNIELNKELISVSTSAFYGCSSLENVYYNGSMLDWCNITFANSYSTPNYYANNIYINNINITGELTIPDKITKINNYTFCGFKNVTDILFNDNLKSIGSYSFARCNGLTHITIPNSIVCIGNYAFFSCSNLEGIQLPENLETISTRTFYKCSKLLSIIIPDKVTYIGKSAFESCSSLENITLSGNIQEICSDAFYRCVSLKDVHFNGDIYSWCAIDFYNSSSNPKKYAENLYYNGELVGESIIIPNDLATINSYAFYNCSQIENVYYEGSLNDWCQISFGNLTSTPNFYAEKFYINGELIPDSITISSSKISNYALYGVGTIKDVTIEDNVEAIGNYALGSCSNLETLSIGNHVKSIGNSAFANCSSIKTLTIPGNVTILGSSVLYNCSNLETIIIENGAISIGSSFFSGCTSLKSVNIPKSVEEIGNSAFYNCNNLESITIPFVGTSQDATGYSSVLGIVFGYTSNSTATGTTRQYYDSSNSYYYYIPSSLKSVTVTNANRIPYGAFYNCSMLNYITISDTATSMGANALYGCTNLEKLTVPFVGASRTATGYSSTFGYPFGYSSSDVTNYIQQYYDSSNSYYYNIPTSVKSVSVTDQSTIPYGAFYNCSMLTDISLNNKTQIVEGSAFYSCSSLEKVFYEGTIESWCSTSFAGNTSHPNYYAKQFFLNNELVDGELVIPNSITNIPSYTFYNFNALTGVTLEAEVSMIGTSAFGNCNNLTKTVFTGTWDEWYNISFSNFSSNPNYYAQKLYIDGELVSGVITLPNYLEKIPNAVFAGCKDITGVVIPNSVTSIGISSFDKCSGLEKVDIPDGVTNIGKDAFYDCSGLKELTVPCSVKYSSNSFKNSTNIEKIIITKGTGSMPDLKTSTLLSSYSYKYTPWYVSNEIKEIIIEDGVERIGNNEFRATYAHSIKIPDSLKTIGSYAFYSDSNLEKIFVPISVETIGVNAISSNTVVYCYSNSIAHTYAAQNELSFVLIDTLLTSNNKLLTIDSKNMLISGFVNGINDISDNFIVSNGFSLSYDKTINRMFTGMSISVNDENGNEMVSYTAVIFGDVNGDGWYDGTDAITVSCIANGLLTREQVGEAVWMAADCNHDGVIDQSDVDLLNQAGVLLANIDQTQSEETLMTDSSYVEYLNLIDQQVEVTSEEAAEDNPETPTQNTWYNFIKLIIDIIKQLISTIKIF